VNVIDESSEVEFHEGRLGSDGGGRAHARYADEANFKPNAIITPPATRSTQLL
jgi:hypothetical protein